MRIPRLVLVAVLAGCASTTQTSTSEAPHDPGSADQPVPTYHRPGEKLKSWAKSVPHGAIGGKPADPADFAREGCPCKCGDTMADCKCLHCVAEAGAKCYCDLGEPKCLCGVDMGGCRCTHCAGREPGGVCPCDHTKTREAMDAAKPPATTK